MALSRGMHGIWHDGTQKGGQWPWQVSIHLCFHPDSRSSCCGSLRSVLSTPPLGYQTSANIHKVHETTRLSWRLRCHKKIWKAHGKLLNFMSGLKIWRLRKILMLRAGSASIPSRPHLCKLVRFLHICSYIILYQYISQMRKSKVSRMFMDSGNLWKAWKTNDVIMCSIDFHGLSFISFILFLFRVVTVLAAPFASPHCQACFGPRHPMALCMGTRYVTPSRYVVPKSVTKASRPSRLQISTDYMGAFSHWRIPTICASGRALAFGKLSNGSWQAQPRRCSKITGAFKLATYKWPRLEDATKCHVNYCWSCN